MKTRSSPSNEAPYRLLEDVVFEEEAVVHPFANLYGCRIGARSRIGTFVEIQRGVSVGSDCKIQSHTFICEGVRIEDGVFIGHGVVFINDKNPRATNEVGDTPTEADWEMLETIVESGASVGSGAVILGGIRIGADAMLGAGAVVSRDVPDGATVAGIPARALRTPSTV
jgi:UDP-2-acetamido-3-amino-2,3-dideoxy-glucuronate N-acetyltransferase